jgi:flavin reductase (DIM6/NTAB) family NADH-FMN oxidoreductase RutF
VMMTMLTHDLPEAPKDAACLGKIPGGLFVLTAYTMTDAEAPEAALVSWVQQAGFEPPMLTVCLKPERPIFDRIQALGGAVLNFLGEDNRDLLRRFASKVGPESFEGLALDRTLGYGPGLQEAIQALDLKLVSTLPQADHTVCLFEVMGVMTYHPDAKPAVHLRKSGANY